MMAQITSGRKEGVNINGCAGPVNSGLKNELGSNVESVGGVMMKETRGQ